MRRIRSVRGFRNPIHRLGRSQEGFSLPLVSVMLVVLLGLAAFATDLGWFYVNASRIQRAADAAALAGVIHMPQDFAQAEVDAKDLAGTNGYVDGVDDATVVVSQVPNEDFQLEVTITDVVPTFFLTVLGIDQVTISRTGRAEYVPPLPMGSPDNQFGNACDPNGKKKQCVGDERPNDQPNFWANIHGKYTNTVMGDAYSSYCANRNGSSNCTQNEAWRSRGYLYGIEKGQESGFSVWFLDMAHRNTSGGVRTSDYLRTGDRGCEDWGDNSPNCGQTVTARLYAPDATPLDVSDNTLLCEYTWTPQPQVDANQPYTYERPSCQAGTLSTFRVYGATDGIYVLQIQVQEPSKAKYSGLNRYSLMVTGASGAPPSTTSARIYGLGDMSIYNNAAGTTTSFYLAEVDQGYRGKTFVVELYDPGESSQTGQLKVIDPTGAVFAQCRIYKRNKISDPWSSPVTASPCVESVTPGEYNGKWIKFEMDLPTTYSCTGDCWWKMNYDYPSSVNDTTTWRAYIVGNPIHLVPNG